MGWTDQQTPPMSLLELALMYCYLGAEEIDTITPSNRVKLVKKLLASGADLSIKDSEVSGHF